ncbi:MAG: putative carboxypeptidase [Firmicutes bacterium]|nr:putative carboxypeptidase [Bacillota bacterium]
MSYKPTEYQDYAKLTEILRGYAADYPHLVRLASVAQSPEGREVWVLTLTNRATGPDTEKPGYLIDGCHHAGEVTATAQALYIVDWLLRQYGTDPDATALLDTRAVYVVPRLTVDASDEYLHTPKLMRSRVALYPQAEEKPGLIPDDVDGDGTIREMRVVDPNGEWKVSARDSRLLVRRQPEDNGAGPFYRLYSEGIIRELKPEGLVESYDGRGVKAAPPRWGLDFNRNYPVNWQMEHRQPGAGPVPFSEPEIRGYADFILAHPNIGGWMTYHTSGGVNLRPGAITKDDKLNQADLARFKAVGDLGQRISGYPHRNLFEVYTANPDRPAIGSTMEFAYDYLGIMLFAPELWDMKGLAGLPSWGKKSIKDIANMSDAEKEEEGLKLLAWDDKANESRGFQPWRKFPHPQLGEVEIGGWDFKHCLQNPPPGRLLEQELTKNFRFAIAHALASPLLAIGRVAVKPLGAALFELAVQVQNTGFLPTQVTEVALQQKRVRGVALTLAGAQVVSQRGADLRGGRYNIGEIAGWGNASDKWVTFVVKAAAGSEVTVTASHDRAGTAQAVFTLKA